MQRALWMALLFSRNTLPNIVLWWILNSINFIKGGSSLIISKEIEMVYIINTFLHSNTFLKRKRARLWQFFFHYTVLLCLLWTLPKIFIHCIFWIPSTEGKMCWMELPLTIICSLSTFQNSSASIFIQPTLHSKYMAVCITFVDLFSFSTILISTLAQCMA